MQLFHFFININSIANAFFEQLKQWDDLFFELYISNLCVTTRLCTCSYSIYSMHIYTSCLLIYLEQLVSMF